MAYPSQATITQLLKQVQAGDRAAVDALFPLLYDELRKRASQQRKRWQGDYTINTTALVHEAYLKLVEQTPSEWTSRAHFLAVAAKAMRHILIDYARQRRTKKRGGAVQKLSLDEMKGTLGGALVLTDARAEALLALEAALAKLALVDAREAQIIECRFFGGMSVEETATALGISARTVRRDRAMAEAWLYRAMTEDA